MYNKKTCIIRSIYLFNGTPTYNRIFLENDYFSHLFVIKLLDLSVHYSIPFLLHNDEKNNNGNIHGKYFDNNWNFIP